MKKQFLTEESVIENSFKLAVKVYESGFRPTFIVGLWRGGSSVGIYLQECLQTLGINTNHISLRTSYRGQQTYHDILEYSKEIRVHGKQYLIESLNSDDALLIVDDVFSTGRNTEAVITILKKYLKRNTPDKIKIATLYKREWSNDVLKQLTKEKNSKNSNLLINEPDFYLETTDNWLVFPYEMDGLTLDEIKEHKKYLLPHINHNLIHDKNL